MYIARSRSEAFDLLLQFWGKFAQDNGLNNEEPVIQDMPVNFPCAVDFFVSTHSSRRNPCVSVRAMVCTKNDAKRLVYSATNRSRGNRSFLMCDNHHELLAEAKVVINNHHLGISGRQKKYYDKLVDMPTRPSVVYPVLLLSRNYTFRSESAVALFVVGTSLARTLIYGAKKGPRRLTYASSLHIEASAGGREVV